MNRAEPELQAQIAGEVAKTCDAARKQGREHREQEVELLDVSMISAEWFLLFGQEPSRAYLQGYFNSGPPPP